MKEYSKTVPTLIAFTEDELALTQQIVLGLIKDLQEYPGGNYDNSKVLRLQHCYETLSTLNGVLTEPVY